MESLFVRSLANHSMPGKDWQLPLVKVDCFVQRQGMKDLPQN